MAELERLMPVAYSRLLDLQQLVEEYGRGNDSSLDQILGLQVSYIVSAKITAGKYSPRTL